MPTLRLSERLWNEILGLRHDEGLTIEKVGKCQALMSLPVFRSGQKQLSAAEVCDLIQLWIADLEHDDQRTAAEWAFALVDDARAASSSTLLPRRRELARLEQIGQDAVRDREDAAIRGLMDQIIGDSIDLVTAESPLIVGSENIALPSPFGAFAEAGLRFATTDFYRAIPWASLLKGAREVDLAFTYARTWRRTLHEPLEEFFERDDTQLRVILPSTERAEGNTALAEIAKRAGQSLEVLSENIVEAREFYLSAGARVWATDAAELYAYYRFDDVAVVSMYNHQRSQTFGVPTVLCERGGSLFDWFANDYAAQIENPLLARPVEK